jgi:hypothetical protein
MASEEMKNPCQEVKILPWAEWRCTMFNIYKPPNWFWRKMQWLFFGFKWEKIK